MREGTSTVVPRPGGRRSLDVGRLATAGFRIRILTALSDSGASISRIASAVGLGRETIALELHRMTTLGAVKTRSRGASVLYRLTRRGRRLLEVVLDPRSAP